MCDDDDDDAPDKNNELDTEYSDVDNDNNKRKLIRTGKNAYKYNNWNGLEWNVQTTCFIRNTAQFDHMITVQN